MRTTLVLLFSAFLAPVLLAQGDEGRRRGRGRDSAPPAELKHFTIENVDLPGAEGVRLAVYLPEGYAAEANAKKQYPWAVWLHGRNENQRKFETDGGARVLDELRGKGEIPELIFVALGIGRSPIYIDGTRAGDQEKLVVEALPRFLAEKYRVLDERGKRALMGVSMGGFGALKMALRHPDKFGVVAAHSSAIMPADPAALPPNYQRQVQRMLEQGGLAEVFGNPIDADKWGKEMPLAMAGTMDKDQLASLRIYFDAGTDDRYGFAKPNQDLHALLEKRGVPHEFELVEGGGHSWGSGSLQKQLVKSLKFVGAAFTAKPATAGSK
jgi:enterochelin esterase family protein